MQWILLDRTNIVLWWLVMNTRSGCLQLLGFIPDLRVQFSLKRWWMLRNGEQNYNVPLLGTTTPILQWSRKRVSTVRTGIICACTPCLLWMSAVLSCKSRTLFWVWSCEQMFSICGISVAALGEVCDFYRPSAEGSLPLDPDWARLMYRFKSFSCKQKIKA